MSDYTIGVTLEATDEASTPIDDVAGSLDDLAEKGGDAATSVGDLDKNAKNADTNMRFLRGAVEGFISVLSLTKVIEFGAQLYQLGDQAIKARSVFQVLSGGSGDATVTLDKLREATNNTVSDVDLMTGANRILAMGIADSNDEMVTMVDTAVTLGQAMGLGPSEAIENFSLLMANQSIPRLDSFGISAQKVRERMDELTASGMDTSEAFSMATMEQATIAMEKLAPVVDANVTAIDRVGTSLDNVKASAGENLATGVNAILDLTLLALGQHPLQAAASAGMIADAEKVGGEYADTFVEKVKEGTGGKWSAFTADDQQIKNSLAMAIDKVKEDPGLKDNANALFASIFGGMADQATIDAFAAAFNATLDQITVDATAAENATKVADAQDRIVQKKLEAADSEMMVPDKEAENAQAIADNLEDIQGFDLTNLFADSSSADVAADLEAAAGYLDDMGGSARDLMGAFQDTVGPTQAVLKNVTDLVAKLDAATATTRTVTIDLKVNDPQGALALIAGGGGSTGGGSGSTRDRGGNVAGMDRRTRE